MITLDTSGLFALINSADRHHAEARAALTDDSGPYIVPVSILSEITYIMEARLPAGVMDDFLVDLAANDYVLDCGEDDIPRIRELVRRYRDMPLGFADSAVIACAERNGGRVLTTDHRHFSVVARGEGTIMVLPH